VIVLNDMSHLVSNPRYTPCICWFNTRFSVTTTSRSCDQRSQLAAPHGPLRAGGPSLDGIQKPSSDRWVRVFFVFCRFALRSPFVRSSLPPPCNVPAYSPDAYYCAVTRRRDPAVCPPP
jgi:hypothetical protein